MRIIDKDAFLFGIFAGLLGALLLGANASPNAAMPLWFWIGMVCFFFVGLPTMIICREGGARRGELAPAFVIGLLECLTAAVVVAAAIIDPTPPAEHLARVLTGTMGGILLVHALTLAIPAIYFGKARA